MAVGTSPTRTLDAAFDAVGETEFVAPRRMRRRTQPAERPRSRIGSINYAVRAPLMRWLEYEAGVAAERYGRYRALDVGCGIKPYEAFFADRAEIYVGVDVSGETDLYGTAEKIPVADGSFDVVLCTQVLEHCLDPAKVVQELRRVVAPGGRVLLSTHGVQVYHPAPQDLWRWTHAGLEHLFRTQADWTSVTVRPASGPAACIGMLMAIYLDLLAKRAHVRFAVRPVVAAINWTAKLVDRLLGNPLRPGSIHANYHVVAER